jgi:hypothetical protein
LFHFQKVNGFLLAINSKIERKNKNTKCTTLSEQFQNPTEKIPVERGKIDTNNLQVYDLPLSWLGTGTSIKSGGVRQVT